MGGIALESPPGILILYCCQGQLNPYACGGQVWNITYVLVSPSDFHEHIINIETGEEHCIHLTILGQTGHYFFGVRESVLECDSRTVSCVDVI